MSWFLTFREARALRRVLGMSRISPRKLAFALLLGVLGMGAAVGLAATSAWLIARASQQPPVLELTVAAVSVRLFGISRAVLRYLQRLASHRVALGGMDSLRLGIYDELEVAPIERVAQLQRGDLLQRTGADVDTVGDFVVKSLLPFSVTFLVGAGTVVGFAFLSVPAALVLLVSMLVSAVMVPALIMRATRQGEIAEQASKRELSVDAMNIVEGADQLRVDGLFPTQMANLQKISQQFSAAKQRAARPAAVAVALDRVAMGFAVIGVFLVATPETNAGILSAVAFAVLVLTPLAAFEGTADLAPAAAQMIRSAHAAVQIDDLLGEPSPPRKTHPLPATRPTTLRCEELAVGWPFGPVVASGFSLDLSPGKRIAVVGPSGIGKTTLLYTLAGMLEPKAGSLTLCGVPMWNANRPETTRLVSLTTEDAHVFATSVYENLRVANANLTRTEASSYLARMGLSEWVAGLPHGLDTQLGAGGTSISGGERRRLLLARALACPAPLMLLDEPGEHLDAKTADQILLELLRGTSTSRGVLLVTHRLSALNVADFILVLGETPAGTRVVHQGTHEQLLKESSYYRWSLEQEK